MPFTLPAFVRPGGTGAVACCSWLGGAMTSGWLVVGVGLPRLGQWLVDHPIMTPVVPAIAAGAFGTVDRPVDWPFVFGLAGVVGLALAASGFVVRHRVNREEFDSTAGPVSEPPSNVRTEPPA